MKIEETRSSTEACLDESPNPSEEGYMKKQVGTSVVAAIVTVVATACSSGSAESVGKSTSALQLNGCSTRDRSEGVAHQCVYNYGPGGSPGFCWLYSIAGSFRGQGEFVRMFLNSSGLYEIDVESQPFAYDDHALNAGPVAAPACVNFSDLGFTAAQIAQMTYLNLAPAAFNAVSPGMGGSGTADNQGGGPTDLASFATVDGRLRNDTACGWPLHTGNCDRAVVLQGVKSDGGALPQQFDAHADEQEWCTAGSTECRIRQASGIDVSTGTGGPIWNLSGTSELFTAPDTSLGIPGGSSLCKLDGIEGFWDANSSATVLVEPDGMWHVQITHDFEHHVGAYVSCFSWTQF